MTDVLYLDRRILVCLKPPGVLSTDEPGGLPDLLRTQLGDEHACLRTVHRLDQAVGGVMVLARSREAARRLSAQVADHTFAKEYLAVVSGVPEPSGTWRDQLARDRLRRKSYVTEVPDRETREAVLRYTLLDTGPGCALLRIQLETGRTHQIRVQCSAHGYPLLGDGKYGGPLEGYDQIALWSHSVAFRHPQTDQPVRFSAPPPAWAPWCSFAETLAALQ